MRMRNLWPGSDSDMQEIVGDINGLSLECVVVLGDITRRQRGEEAVQEAEGLANSLQDSGLDTVVDIVLNTDAEAMERNDRVIQEVLDMRDRDVSVVDEA